MTAIFDAIFNKISGKNRASVDLSGSGREIIDVLRVGQYAVYSKPLQNSKVVLAGNTNRKYIILEKIAQNLSVENELGDGDFAIDTGNVRLHFKHSSKTLEISGAINVNIKGATNINLGENGFSLINENLVKWLDAHTHPAAGGATGVPAVLAETLKESFTTKIVKGA
jgi:hypothetical protein